MTTQEYKAIGYFYAFYERNLEHIANFQKFKKGIVTFDDYLSKGRNSFPRFLAEFRVARNLSSESVPKLLKLTREWVKSSTANNVDQFANKLLSKGISDGKLLVSLSSKVLHLNNPHEVLPIDSQVKKSVGQKSIRYADYIPQIKELRKSTEFERLLQHIERFSNQVESKFHKDIPYLKQVRENRLIDIYLWSKNGT